MGCDGGTIPTRDELVKQKQKPEQVDKEAERAAKWQYCASSQEELKQPIVACQLGKLYNKEIILNHLITKTLIPNAPHIKSLKHVKNLNLTLNPKYLINDVAATSSTLDTKMATKGIKSNYSARYICPVLGLDMNGTHKFCYIITCGCVISEKALKEIKEARCPKCNTVYSRDLDIITLNPDEAELEALKVKIVQRLANTKLKNGQTLVCQNGDEISKHKKTNEISKTFKKTKRLLAEANDVPSPTLSTSANTNNIVKAAVLESHKKLCREDFFASKAYKSIFSSSTQAPSS
ncbi:unnamed protein product [Gordionus sp. m RMFG-2023]|uniref:replication termination factor 2-like n=1 Tax=Gordionus sp. m RMFG-2023 TaxID=3053472 RepID=UPI0030E411F7